MVTGLRILRIQAQLIQARKGGSFRPFLGVFCFDPMGVLRPQGEKLSESRQHTQPGQASMPGEVPSLWDLLCAEGLWGSLQSLTSSCLCEELPAKIRTVTCK